MVWTLKAQVTNPVEGDDGVREYVYEDESHARKGFEAMQRNGYHNIALVADDGSVEKALVQTLRTRLINKLHPST